MTAFLITSILLTLTPGPDILLVLSLSLSKGAQKGILFVLGLISGIIIHTSLIAFGVSALIIANLILFNSIKILGALYLFYLAYKTYQSNDSLNLKKQDFDTNNSALLKRGFLMNVLNPKVTLFFLAFFPKFINPDSDIFFETYKLGFTFMLQAFIIFSTVAILAGKLSQNINNTAFNHFIKWFQIVILLGIGIFVLL